MPELDTIVVVLDVTACRASWELTYGMDPKRDIPDYLEGGVGQLECLSALPGMSPDGAPVRVAASEERTETETRARGFITMRVVLDVGVNTAAWRARYGLPPQDSLAMRVAEELNRMAPMRSEVNGTAIPVPLSGGVLVGETTFRMGGRG